MLVSPGSRCWDWVYKSENEVTPRASMIAQIPLKGNTPHGDLLNLSSHLTPAYPGDGMTPSCCSNPNWSKLFQPATIVLLAISLMVIPLTVAGVLRYITRSRQSTSPSQMYQIGLTRKPFSSAGARMI